MIATKASWAEVPGKIIITGEHAVVYGQPALAVAINQTAHAKCQLVSGQDQHTAVGITLNMPQIGLSSRLSIAQLQQLHQQVNQRHQQFLHEHLPLSEVLSAPADLLLAAIGYTLHEYSLPVTENLRVDLHTQLLLGSGMGSSAAIIAAIIAAMVSYFQGEVAMNTLYEHVVHIEQWQHGRSSGLDPWVCIQGGMHYYQKGQHLALHLELPSHTYMVASGKPQSTTGECVEWVRKQQFSNEYWSSYGSICRQLQQALQERDQCRWLANLHANQHLLQQLAIVPNRVAQFIAQIEQAGGASKLCGAGSITGEHGGVLLVSGLVEGLLAPMCSQAGYSCWPLQVHDKGLQYGCT